MLQLAMTMLATQAIILLLLRPVILWYLRINHLRAILLSIDASLKCLPAVRDQRTRPRRFAS